MSTTPGRAQYCWHANVHALCDLMCACMHTYTHTLLKPHWFDKVIEIFVETTVASGPQTWGHPHELPQVPKHEVTLTSFLRSPFTSFFRSPNTRSPSRASSDPQTRGPFHKLPRVPKHEVTLTSFLRSPNTRSPSQASSGPQTQGPPCKLPWVHKHKVSLAGHFGSSNTSPTPR